MARITVEDCLEKVQNRFTLVLVTAERTKQLMRGSRSFNEDDRSNKEIVTALREIAAGHVRPDLTGFDENENVGIQLGGGDVPGAAALPPSADDAFGPRSIDDTLPPEA
jgi:DNA-directed RNA polymerase subunit omega